MELSQLESVIEQAWEDRKSLSPATSGDVREAVDVALAGLDAGRFAWPKKSTVCGRRTSG